MIRTVGEALPHLLAARGVQVVFGMPGVHSLELYRTLGEAGLRHVGVRHEQGAGFMADGYARASGMPGVAWLISGPGLTNASTAIGQSYSDSVPVLVVTAAIDTLHLGMGHGRLHEISDQRAMSAPLTGASMIALHPAQLSEHVARAFARFAVLRPRPVHLALPLDVLAMPYDVEANLPVLPSPPGPDPRAIAALAAAMAKASKIAILAGGGAVKAGPALLDLVERTGALFVTTVAGKGIIPESHPLSLGASLQRLPTRRCLAEADLVIAIGTEIAEPDLYVTADAEASGSVDPALMRPELMVGGHFARIDLDPDVLARTPLANFAILSDARLAAEALVSALPLIAVPDRKAEAASLRAANHAQLSLLEHLHDDVLLAIRAALPPDGMVFADMTQIAYTGCVTFPVEGPRQWLFPMGFGTLGYALPAAIGGQIACPRRAVVALAGDGGFQFTLAELATAVEERLPVAIVLWDNDGLAEIEHFMRARQIPLVSVRPKNPDFALIAKAYGCGYHLAATMVDLTAAVSAAFTRDGPTLIHARQSDLAAR